MRQGRRPYRLGPQHRVPLTQMHLEQYHMRHMLRLVTQEPQDKAFKDGDQPV